MSLILIGFGATILGFLLKSYLINTDYNNNMMVNEIRSSDIDHRTRSISPTIHCPIETTGPIFIHI